jgi:hypothetical protein
LARPGALDFVDRYADYSRTGEFQSIHPFFDDVLSSTGGLCLYQEQTLQMCKKIGFSLDEAEQLRRIIGKKKVDQMVVWQDKIKNKIIENDLDPIVGDVFWKVASDSANYSFNKCIFEGESIELFNGKKIKLNQAEIGDSIKCFNYTDAKEEYKIIKDIMTNEVEIFEIELDNGYKIKTSSKHRFICEDGIKRTFSEIEKLDIGIIVS